MLRRFKENRLKVASFFALSGDVFVGLAGGIGLWRLSFETVPYACLTVGGLLAVLGHCSLLIWGKGARPQAAADHVQAQPSSIFLKPFVPWRYPLDTGFMLFILANVFYFTAGILMNLPALSLSGFFAGVASALGWLWPPARKILGLFSMQAVSLCYLIASINQLAAGFISMNIMIILSGFCYVACNVILFTVRKENQSVYTQTHGS